jgi:hypothetical protein
MDAVEHARDGHRIVGGRLCRCRVHKRDYRRSTRIRETGIREAESVSANKKLLEFSHHWSHSSQSQETRPQSLVRSSEPRSTVKYVMRRLILWKSHVI